MANTPTRLSVVQFEAPGSNPVNPSTYVCARVLAASSVAETITVPANAAYVRLIGTADFFYSITGTAAVPAADIDDGTANELVNVSAADGRWLVVNPSTSSSISVVTTSSGSPVVIASFYTN